MTTTVAATLLSQLPFEEVRQVFHLNSIRGDVNNMFFPPLLKFGGKSDRRGKSAVGKSDGGEEQYGVVKGRRRWKGKGDESRKTEGEE